MEKRRDKESDVIRMRRKTVEHPFGPMNKRMEATHCLAKTLPKLAIEMALCVATYNLTLSGTSAPAPTRLSRNRKPGRPLRFNRLNRPENQDDV